jgi:membrane associated rhomboid family serine protease
MNFYNNPNIHQNPFQDIRGLFRSKSILIKLILINVAVWLVIMFLDVLFDLLQVSFTEKVIGWLAVPASLDKLIMRPWTLITYMFLHFDIWHILFNMLWLYWFGKIFLEYLSARQMLATYIMGGLSGAFLYILSFNIFPKFQDAYLQSVALGASASVVAIVVAISVYVPNYRIQLLFLGPVKIIYIALFSIILDFLMIRSANSGGHLAHLGGALWGFLFVFMLRKGTDLSKLFDQNSWKYILKPFQRSKKPHFKNVYTNPRKMTDEDYNLQKKQNQERIDGILDKISRSGYDALSKEEKDLLFRTSNKNSSK